MPFLNSLQVKSDVGSKLVELTEPLVFTYQEGAIVVPKGFRTDFASIPRLFKNIIDDNDPAIREPSVVHDYLYSRPCDKTRKECDAILALAMKEVGASKWQIAIVYASVRLFGGSHWMA